MKRKYLYILVSIILVFLLSSCYDIATPEVQIWRTTPLGFVVSEFDSSFEDVQTREGGASFYNPDPVRWWLDSENVTTDSVEGLGRVWRVPLLHYWDHIWIDSVTFWVRNGVDAYLNGYYAEFYKSNDYGVPVEFLYEHPADYLQLYLRASVRMTDTVMISLLHFPVTVREAVKMMYAEPYDTMFGSILARIHFFGEDAYGEGKTFEITQDYLVKRKD
jgi:hypothetical protein